MRAFQPNPAFRAAISSGAFVLTNICFLGCGRTSLELISLDVGCGEGEMYANGACIRDDIVCATSPRETPPHCSGEHCPTPESNPGAALWPDCLACPDPPTIGSGKLEIRPSHSIVALCGGRVLLGNRLHNRLELFDVLEDTMLMAWDLPGPPGKIVYDIFSDRAFVTLDETAAVAKIQLSYSTVELLALPSPARYLALSPKGTLFASLESKEIAIVDETGLNAVPIPWGSAPLLAFEQRTNQLFMATDGLGTAWLARHSFDQESKTLKSEQNIGSVGENGNDLAISPDGRHLAFALGGEDMQGHRVNDVRPEALNEMQGAWLSNEPPILIKFAMDGSKLLVATHFEVLAFRVGEHELIKSFPLDSCVNGMVKGLGVSPAGGLVYVVVTCGFKATEPARLLWFSL